MAVSESTPRDAGSGADVAAAGSYEVLRARLAQQAAELGGRVQRLNARRQEVFGGIELSVLGNTRVRTENNCVPRDIVQVGGHLLFGYNVFVGLRTETHVRDVLGLHELRQGDDGFDLHELPPDTFALLESPQFVREFSELYSFYKDARLVQLRTTETKLLAVFQVGGQIDDVRVFRWALDPQGRTSYIDNRGERDLEVPPTHGFEWSVATRDNQVAGRYPHLNILDQVFVETTGGDLTVKIENNTATGEGIYSEPVDDPRQSVDDADVQYAKVGTLILLKVRPYGESQDRYLVFNTRTKRVDRIDNIGQACVELPEDHGLIFPGGYYLVSGETKTFEGDVAGLMFHRAVRSPNGEDVLYVFYQAEEGRYVMLPYNLIQKQVQRPLTCHGYSLFDDGKMVVFRSAGDEPTRVHPMQIWQTPFVSAEHAARAPSAGGFLGKVGNADLVRGISDALSICRLAEHPEPRRETFEDLVAAVVRATDAYYWLAHEAVGDLAAPLHDIRQTAELVIDEYEKVVALQRRAGEALTDARERQLVVLRGTQPSNLTSVDGFMKTLTTLRSQRGHVITLRELRYIDLDVLATLEAEVVAAYDEVSQACVSFLLDEASLRPLFDRLETIAGRIEAVDKSTDLAPLTEDLEATGQGVDALGEVVTGLETDDPVARAKMLEGISEVLAQLNRVRALLENRRQSIAVREGRAEFAAQFQLFSQSVSGAIAQADTPARCDEGLSRLLVQLEELEGRFGEFDEFIGDLTAKREEVYDAFGAKKQQLLDERQRRAGSILSAANRIFEGIARRVQSFREPDELNAYFAADALVLKVRDFAERLRELEDAVHAEEIESKLKAARQDALRGLRDRIDLFEGGDDLIKLGRHRFSVNRQALELTLIPREGELRFHLAGTDYLAAVEDAAFEATREFWDQPLVSESPTVYRGEYLAASVLRAAEGAEQGLTLAELSDAVVAGRLLEIVRQWAANRYDEGYERGVHDADGAAVLDRVLSLRSTAGLLRFAPTSRALAAFFWSELEDRELKARLGRLGQSLGRLRGTFSSPAAQNDFSAELATRIANFLRSQELPASSAEVRAAGQYLAAELAQERLRFTTSSEATQLVNALLANLDRRAQRLALEDDLRALGQSSADRFRVALAWLRGFLATGDDELGLRAEHLAELAPAVVEAAVLLITGAELDRESTEAMGQVVVTGLLGRHPRIEDGVMKLRLDEFTTRLDEFVEDRVPRYQAYRQLRHQVLERERGRLRLEELKPRVLSAFVRNRLIDGTYLPLIGENLAKQIGAAGATKRTDTMGLLLVVSPPGYGKTTLMEYVANRLGLVFMKVNGPSLGHTVTSFDPAEASSATARQEVEKINLAFEMGNNVMLYLDDIQHTNPELLQKFISLCDAQRRVEGVWRGKTQTYDLRGKRFCVVMAGNPYTESGEKFQIPDMLANRADTYNLGDILEGKGQDFALSYLENSLTSNPVLAPLAGRAPADVYRFLCMAQGADIPTNELEHDYSAVEVQEIVSVLKKLGKCQELLLQVNQEYIRSASMEDAYRTEPPFKLQGSYRNMNKLAEKVVAALNDDELEALLDDHYAGEAQTLTTGAESNLLRLAELRERMTPEQSARWQQIKSEFSRLQTMGGQDDDPVTRLTGTLSGLGSRLEAIRAAVSDATAAADRRAAEPRLEPSTDAPPAWIEPQLERLGQALAQLGGHQLQIEVQNQPPPGLDTLLDRQVALVERMVYPLVDALSSRRADTRALGEKLQELMTQLAEVRQLMQVAEQRVGR